MPPIEDEYMPTFMLKWNPHFSDWAEYEEFCSRVKAGEVVETKWGVSTKNPRAGHRFVMMVQGEGNHNDGELSRNGIIAVGVFCTDPYVEWGDRYIGIKIYRMWDYKKDNYPMAPLLKKKFPEYNFKIRINGMSLPDEILPRFWKFIEEWE